MLLTLKQSLQKCSGFESSVAKEESVSEMKELDERLQAYQLLTLLFMKPIDDAVVEWMNSQEAVEIMEEVGVSSSSEELSDLDLLNTDRTYLLRALAPDVGAPPPYESFWTAKEDAESVILSLQQVYRENGMQIDSDVHDRPDYLGVEIAFLQELAERESEALQNGDEEAAGEYRVKQTEFIDDHLRAWVPKYVEDRKSVV